MYILLVGCVTESVRRQGCKNHGNSLEPEILETNENGVSIDNIFDNLLREASSKLQKSEHQSRGETFQFNAMIKYEVIQDPVRRRKSFSTPLSILMWNYVRTLD